MIRQFELFFKRRLRGVIWTFILAVFIFAVQMLPGMNYLIGKEIFLFLVFALFYLLVGLDENVFFWALVGLIGLEIISLLTKQNSTAELLGNFLFVSFGGLVLKRIINFLK